MYVKLWDEKGQPWDVTPDRVGKLIVEAGWTYTPPEQTPETILGVPYNTAYRQRLRAEQKDD